MNTTDPAGYFMTPQHFSVNDGDGIRTVIFFAGCPLRCAWCSNPECFDMKKQTLYHAEDLLKMIEKQRLFYRLSGGGVTFSGGEATHQTAILRELVNILYDRAIDLAIETSGFFEFDAVKDILLKMDMIFVDIKHMDPDKHRLFTGQSNDKILENIQRMNDLNVPLVVRIPVIDNVNSDAINIRKTAKFVKENLRQPRIELLPYHEFGGYKYETLGLLPPPTHFKTPSSKTLQFLRKVIEGEGVENVSYK